MNIAEKLVKLRKEQGLTQYKLAQQLNISIASIKNYENIKNPREPKNDILLKFADFYNVSTEYLLNDNITNKTKDTINIGNKINLSDNAIEKIIKIRNSNKYNVVETFINIIPENFWNIINRYIELNKKLEALKPLQQILQYSNLLKKYSVNEDLGLYLEFYEEINGCVLNFDAYCKNNKCKYTIEDKQKILNCIKILKENEALKESDETKANYFIHKYGFSIDTVEKIVNSNSYIPLSIVNDIISIPNSEIEDVEACKEVAKLSLNEIFINLFKQLDNEYIEAE